MSGVIPETPVLIVGAGPVGLALAGDLAWRGIPSVTLEASDGTITQPKMDLVGVRTMEFCRRWGIAAQVEFSPYNRDYSQDYAWVSSVTGFEFGREEFPSKRLQRPPAQSPEAKQRCPQNMFDPILRGWVQSMPVAELRYEHRVVAVDQDEDGVRATVDGPDGTYELTASYAVGCDGAAGTIRQALGESLEDNAALTYTTNAIFRSEELAELVSSSPAYRFIVLNELGPWSTLVAIDGNTRWRFSLIGDNRRTQYSQEEIRAAVEVTIGRSIALEIESIVPWARREMLASKYSSGRLFIAGDAAHLMSPTGGYGMNTGIGDAVDLGWKLAAVIAGWGGPNLLESYQAERRPVGLRNVDEATGNLHRMLSAREYTPPPVAFEDSEAGAQARREYGDWYTSVLHREWHGIGIHLGYVYEHSPICVPDGTPPPADEVESYTQISRPGSRAPHVWLTDRLSTLDLFGRGFVLLRSSVREVSDRQLADAARDTGVQLRIIDIDAETLGADYEYQRTLVRPDGHVAWRGDRIPEEPQALLETVRGAGIGVLV
jgi:2-polyprenyl-6-methoxyphenol hydroxylase-like FAD-dependent oxidoreductase